MQQPGIATAQEFCEKADMLFVLLLSTRLTALLCAL